MNFLKLYWSKLIASLVTHRMKSKRILFVVVAFLILFTEPKISCDTFWEIIFDWTGYTLIVFACFGRAFSSVFICGRKNEELSTKGPFSLVRNPLYVFSFIGTVGVGFLTGYITFFVLFVGLFLFYYPSVVKSEEKFLQKKFGDAYTQYKHDVPRWIPKHWKWDLPETIIVYPTLLLQTMRDAAVFFLVFPLMESIEVLHETGALPTLFSLY